MIGDTTLLLVRPGHELVASVVYDATLAPAAAFRPTTEGGVGQFGWPGSIDGRDLTEWAVADETGVRVRTLADYADSGKYRGFRHRPVDDLRRSPAVDLLSPDVFRGDWGDIVRESLERFRTGIAASPHGSLLLICDDSR